MKRATGVPLGAQWLIVGLGNPGTRYAHTRHNIGFEVAQALVERWSLGRSRKRFAGRIYAGRAGASTTEVAVLMPETFMNEAGRSVGPARGTLKLALDRVVVIHDDIDLAFGEVRVRIGGGLAGHNGLKSIRSGLGSADFRRIRVGVGRPESTDPDVVADYVLSPFAQDREAVRDLTARAAVECERLVAEAG